jgi:hypothetical protein
VLKRNMSRPWKMLGLHRKKRRCEPKKNMIRQAMEDHRIAQEEEEMGAQEEFEQAM